MLGSIGVIAASLVMLITGWYRADPLVSAAIGLFILPRTWTLLKQVGHVLMEGTPAGLDLKSVQQAMEKLEGVKAVHDLHAWVLTSGVNVLTAHVTVEALEAGDRIRQELESLVKKQFGICHTTIQLEGERCTEQDMKI